MPLLEIDQIHHIFASVRLDESAGAQVDQYAAFIHASADDFVDKALNHVFSKDRDFQDFLKTPQAKRETWTLHSVKARAVARPKSLLRSLQRCGVCGSEDVEGMIPHSISWWGENGASHRKNFDTPPREGSCRAILEARWAATENRLLAETR